MCRVCRNSQLLVIVFIDSTRIPIILIQQESQSRKTNILQYFVFTLLVKRYILSWNLPVEYGLECNKYDLALWPAALPTDMKQDDGISLAQAFLAWDWEK